jgi:hypothetical protein
MGGVFPFAAGMIVGVVAVVLFIVLNATRPARVLPVFIHTFQLMRLHFGRNSLIAGLTNERGWRIEVRCLGCHNTTALAPDTTDFVCVHCNRPFKLTGMEVGGSGVNVIEVETRK